MPLLLSILWAIAVTDILVAMLPTVVLLLTVPLLPVTRALVELELLCLVPW